jgi:hypothetical protein
MECDVGVVSETADLHAQLVYFETVSGSQSNPGSESLFVGVRLPRSNATAHVGAVAELLARDLKVLRFFVAAPIAALLL